MIENITSIKITGGPYASQKSLKVFGDNINIIYGSNGSGKSTIAKAVRCAKGESITNYSGSFDIEIDEKTRKNIYVYDEQFVRRNVLIDQDDIGSIVMLGQQVELDETIRSLNIKREHLEQEKEKLENEFSKFTDPKNILAPDHIFNDIRKSLREKGGWADNNRTLKNNRINSTIDQGLIERLSKCMPDNCSIEDLYKSFEEGKSKYNLIIDKDIVNLRLESNADLTKIQAAIDVLNKKVNKPELTDRDRAVIEAIQEEDRRYLNDTKRIFSRENISRCPLCLQEISSDYKDNLLKVVQAYFNKEVEKYKAECSDWQNNLENWKAIEVPKQIYDILKTELGSSLRQASLILERQFKMLAKQFNNKKTDVFSFHSDIDRGKLESALSEYNKCISDINSHVNSYNRDVINKERLKNELLDLNDKLASYKNRALINSYFHSKEKENNIKNQMESLASEIGDLTREIIDLNAQKRKISIALDFINSYLAYIFFDKSHLKLKADAGKYKILVDNRDVKPELISTGERNALALCYFFAKSFENKEAKHKFDEEKLFVIDDPVSSYDQANKVGIMSFLRMMLSQIYKGNPQSKILILTHDRQVFFDFQKVRSDILGKKNTRSFQLTKSHELHVENGDRSLYKHLLGDVFNFAKAEPQGENVNIGNTMRKLLEAFFTFTFNGSFTNALRDNKVLDLLPEKKRSYYGNLMSRLILNSESHTEECIYSLNDFNDLYDVKEMRKTAKSILTLLYNINYLHLEKYLGHEETEEIRKWTCEDKIDEIDSPEIYQ